MCKRVVVGGLRSVARISSSKMGKAGPRKAISTFRTLIVSVIVFVLPVPGGYREATLVSKKHKGVLSRTPCMRLIL